MLQTRSSILLVAQVNTQAGGSAVVITNSNNLYVYVQNSAGWAVNVANSAGWAVYAIDSQATGSVVSAIASTVGTVVLAASQAKRVSLAIYNASTQPLYMKLGSGAKSTDFTLMMVASGYYELPRPIYNGQITGVWSTANGSCYVTETT